MKMKLCRDYDGDIFTSRQWQKMQEEQETILKDWYDNYIGDEENFERWLNRRYTPLQAIHVGLTELYSRFCQYIWEDVYHLYDGNEYIRDFDDYEEVEIEFTEEDLC